MLLAPLRLKKREERRILGGHAWVYSNEIDTVKTPLHNFAPGQPVVIEAANGKALGSGYVNPHALICARLISRNPQQQLDKDWLVAQLRRALSWREQHFTAPYYRLVFGESDGLPGLVIDRYGNTLVTQITTAGMQRVQTQLAAALQEVLQPEAVLLRNDTRVRELEGLETTIEALVGKPAAQVRLVEHGAQFWAHIINGQKTGWFYDQAANRARLSPYVTGKRVLEVFSYSGAWSIQAALAGAKEVWAVDSSAQALSWLQDHARLNNVYEKITTIQQDAFVALNTLREGQEKFEVIILDPPAFIKRRKDAKEGLNAYRRLHQAALRLLQPGGVLISASCSLHLARENLLEIIRATGCHGDRYLQILEQGHQNIDHPVHPAIAETDYLKAFFTGYV